MEGSRRDRAVEAFDGRHLKAVAWSRASRRVTRHPAYFAGVMGYAIAGLVCVPGLFVAFYSPSIGSLVLGLVSGVVVLVPPTVLYVVIRRRMLREREILLGERCGACEYDLRGLDPAGLCPECGEERARAPVGVRVGE